MTVAVRPAPHRDLSAIRDIYNYAIRELPSSFDISEKTLSERESWFAAHPPQQYPVFVAEEDDAVAGWSSLSPYSDRAAYRYTVETSIYLYPEYQGRGIGTQLLDAAMCAARALGYHAVIARIVDSNAASIRLHRKFGFLEVGVMREVGWKFNTWHDVLLMEALIESG